MRVYLCKICTYIHVETAKRAPPPHNRDDVHHVI